MLPVVSVLVALLAAMSAGTTPWAAALGGSVRPPDLAQDVAAARLVGRGTLAYSEAFQAEHAAVYGVNPNDGYRYLPHPPFTILLAMPLAHVSLPRAAAAWFASSLVLLFVIAIFMAESWTGLPVDSWTGPRMRITLTFFVLLLAWPPVLYNLEKGQFSILIALLVALAGRTLHYGHHRIAGICVGVAASVKIFPVILGGYLLMRGRRALPYAAAAALATTGTALAMMPEGTWSAFLAHSTANVGYWATWPSVTYGLHGVTARSFVGGPWATPFVHAPALGTGIYLGVSAGLVVLAAAASRSSNGSVILPWSAWSILLVLLNPLAMPHNAVLLAVPLAAIGARLRQAGSTSWRLAWLLSLALISIPRPALSGLAPLPTTPWAGLVVMALPCWGTLLLLLLAINMPDGVEGVRRSRCGPA